MKLGLGRQFYIAVVFSAFLLSGCVGHSVKPYPIEPADQATYYVEQAAERIAEEKISKDLALSLVRAVERPTGEEKAQELMARNLGVSNQLFSSLQQIALHSEDKRELNDISRYLKVLGNSGILNNTEMVLSQINDRVKQSNINHEIMWSVYDDTDFLSSLNDADNRMIILKRSLDTLKAPSHLYSLAPKVAEFISLPEATNAERQLVKSSIPSLHLKRREVIFFDKLFPDTVKSYLDNLSVSIRLSVTPVNRLLEEDLKDKLQSSSQNFSLLRKSDSSNKKVITVEIEELETKYRESSEQVETIRYPRYNVDTFKAALLMPDNAVYAYDLKQRGAKLKYAYVIKVNQNGKTLLDDLVRGEETVELVNCSNKRIINVFGGVSPASFDANDDMRTRCNHSTSETPSESGLEQKVQSLLVKKIISVAPLSAAL